MSEASGPAKGQSPAGGLNLQLNPERAPALIAKWRKLLGKDLKKIEVVYDAEGVQVYLFGEVGTVFHKTDGDGDISISVAEYKAIKAEAAKPSASEALTAFKNKFEVRLNLPFPEDSGMTDASPASVEAFLRERPFDQRRAMLMSGKQFKAAYPLGFGAAAPNRPAQ